MITYEVVDDKVISKQLFKDHNAAHLEPSDHKLVVKSRAGDAEGPLQAAFERRNLAITVRFASD